MPEYIPPPPDRTELLEFMEQFRRLFDELLQYCLFAAWDAVQTMRRDLRRDAENLLIICERAGDVARDTIDAIELVLNDERAGRLVNQDRLWDMTYRAVFHKEACYVAWQEWLNMYYGQ